MDSTKKNARVAGFLYLLLLGAPLRLVYIPSTLFVSGNATAAANNIPAHELLFRLGIVCDLLTGPFSIFLFLLLFRLLNGGVQCLPPLQPLLCPEIPTPLSH